MNIQQLQSCDGGELCLGCCPVGHIRGHHQHPTPTPTQLRSIGRTFSRLGLRLPYPCSGFRITPLLLTCCRVIRSLSPPGAASLRFPPLTSIDVDGLFPGTKLSASLLDRACQESIYKGTCTCTCLSLLVSDAVWYKTCLTSV